MQKGIGILKTGKWCREAGEVIVCSDIYIPLKYGWGEGWQRSAGWKVGLRSALFKADSVWLKWAYPHSPMFSTIFDQGYRT